MTAEISALLALICVGLIYYFPLRAWYRHWGATVAEIGRAILGDNEASDANYETTLAVTIDAAPVAVWPWLVQMGYRRGGLYSYDWLDRAFGFLDASSADRILPEYQKLEAGDVIPVGRGAGFPVRFVEAQRTLVLAGASDGFRWVWQFGLYPVNERQTRLISRNRASVPHTVRWTLFVRLLEPAAFIMTRKMLLGIKRRAEAMAQMRDVAAA
jgi:hypothetical protein